MRTDRLKEELQALCRPVVVCRPVIARAALAGGVPRVVDDDVDEADSSPDGRELAIVRSMGGPHCLEYRWATCSS